MVKLPICTLCAKTAVLCPNCRAKLRKGEINDTDIAIAEHIAKIERKYPKLKKARIRETIDMGETVIIVADRAFADFWNDNEKARVEIGDILKKQVITIVKSKTIKATLQNIFSPLEIEGLDMIYLPVADDDQELKIRLRGDIEQLTLSADILKEIASKVTGKIIRLELPGENKDTVEKKPVEPLY
ncbi:MAG: hypothetical protein ACTSP4_11780 [Candidatus Hodarchaeales archaeon]